MMHAAPAHSRLSAPIAPLSHREPSPARLAMQVQGLSARLPAQQRPRVKAPAPAVPPEGLLVGSPFVGPIRYQLYCWFCNKNQGPEWEG